jgi:hypothetical protein
MPKLFVLQLQPLTNSIGSIKKNDDVGEVA